MRVAWWRNGRASDLWSGGRRFDAWSRLNCITTLSKLFTPTCFNANSLCYHMESLNGVPLPLPVYTRARRPVYCCYITYNLHRRFKWTFVFLITTFMMTTTVFEWATHVNMKIVTNCVSASSEWKFSDSPCNSPSSVSDNAWPWPLTFWHVVWEIYKPANTETDREARPYRWHLTKEIQPRCIHTQAKAEDLHLSVTDTDELNLQNVINYVKSINLYDKL